MNKKIKTVHFTLTLPKDKAEALKKQAANKGIPMPTYCRLLLCGFAEVPAKVAA